MAGEKTPQSIQAFLALVPMRPKPSHIVHCTESKQGEAFFRDFTGAKITGVLLLRYKSKDVVAFTTDDKRVIGIIGEKETFIAVEKKGQNKKSDANLAFRDDISHTRLDLVASFAANDDITYKDKSFISGETVGVDPSAEFTQIALDKGIEVQTVTPSWYTEDWFTIRSPQRDSLIIRADRNHILGAVAITPKSIDYLKIGDSGDFGDLKLAEPPIGSIPSQIKPAK